MALPRLIRWSGGVLLVSGVLLLGLLLHPDETQTGARLLAVWTPVHVIAGIGILLSVVGLIGIYLRLGRKAGVLGLVGFLLTFLSTAVFAGAILTLEAFVAPVLARDAAALLDPAGPLLAGPLGIVFLLVGVAFALGVILLGAAIIRSRVLPVYTGVLLILGSVIAFVPPLPLAVLIVGTLVLAAAYITIGYTIYTTPDKALVAEVETVLVEKMQKPAA